MTILIAILALPIFLFETWRLIYNPLQRMADFANSKDKEVEQLGAAFADDYEVDVEKAADGCLSLLFGCSGLSLILFISYCNGLIAVVLTVIALVTQLGNQYAAAVSLLVLIANTAYFLIASFTGVKKGYSEARSSDKATILVDGEPVTGQVVPPSTDEESDNESDSNEDEKASFGSHFYRVSKYLPMAYLGYLFLVTIGLLN